MTAEFMPLRAIHAEVAAALHAAGMRHSAADEVWDAAAIAGLLAVPGTFGLLAMAADAAPAGFVLGRVAADESEILTLVVAPEARRSGIGRALLLRSFEHARSRGAMRLFLEVAEDNEAGRALYRSCGLAAVGRRPAYYRRAGGAVDAIVMGRAL